MLGRLDLAGLRNISCRRRFSGKRSEMADSFCHVRMPRPCEFSKRSPAPQRRASFMAASKEHKKHKQPYRQHDDCGRDPWHRPPRVRRQWVVAQLNVRNHLIPLQPLVFLGIKSPVVVCVRAATMETPNELRGSTGRQFVLAVLSVSPHTRSPRSSASPPRRWRRTPRTC